MIGAKAVLPSAALLICGLWTNLQGQSLRSVFVKNSEVYVAQPGQKEARQLTADGLPKSLPVWSKDGTQIAFQRGAQGRAMAELVTMRPDGTPIRSVLFRPLDSHIEGMRFIEGLGWVSDHRVVAYGGVNPSTVDYSIVDLAVGKEVGWYGVDGFLWAASPDGSHAAYVGLVPHFTPEADRRPQLCFDGECGMSESATGAPALKTGGYPNTRMHLEFGTAPVWSPDGTAVAIAAEDYNTKARDIVVRPLEGRASVYPLPDGVTDPLQVVWGSEGLAIVAGDHCWRLPARASAFVRVDAGAAMIDFTRALRMLAVEKETFAKQGVTDFDCWCESCPIRVLARRRTNTPIYGSRWVH